MNNVEKEKTPSKDVKLLLMTSFQRRIVVYGLTSLCACLLGGAIFISLHLLGLFTHKLMPLLTPVVLGLFFSFVLRPLYGLFRKKMSHEWAFSLIAVSLVLLVGGLACLLGNFVCPQVKKLVLNLPDIFQNIVNNLPNNIKDWVSTITLNPRDLVARYGSNVLDVTVQAFGVLASIVNLLFAVFFSYYFLKCPLKGTAVVADVSKAYENFIERVNEFKSDWKAALAAQIDCFCRIMSGRIPCQVFMNLIEGGFGAVWCYCFKVPGGFILGFLLGFLNVIPLFGTFAMLPIVLPVAYWANKCVGYETAPHGWVCVAIVVAGWGFIQAIDQGWPYFYEHMKKTGEDSPRKGGAGMDDSLPPWLIVASFLFWGAVLNPICGLVLALPLTAFFKSALRNAVVKK